MITTKKGASEKGQVNFRSTWGYSNLAVDLPRALTPQEFTQLTWYAMRNGQLDNPKIGSSLEEANQYATANLKNELKVNPFSVDQPVGLNGEMDPNAQLLYWGDWRNEVLKSRMRQEYNLDFSGKNDRADYFFSGGYVNDKGIFAAQEFERFSLRSNLNYQVKNWLKVGTNTSLSHSRREVWLDSNTIWFLRTISPTYPVYLWDAKAGDYRRDSNGNRIYDFGDNRQAWISWNPLADAAYNPSPETTNNVSTRNYIEISFLPELKFRTNFSIDHYSRTYDGYTNPEYGFASGYGGQISKSVSQNLSYTINNLLTYDKAFGDHRMSVLLGQEAYSMHYKYLYAAKRGLPFLGLTEINSASVMNSMSSYYDKYRLLSWLSRVEYEYKDRYYVSGSFRTDGSSRFHPDSRWGEFWSVGTSWRLSNEEFMSSYGWIDNLKLKASYGAVGNDNLATYYAYQGLYATGNNDYNEAGVLVSRLPNPKLKWETNLQLNVGIEFTLFNKLSGEFEWFNRKSKDLLFGMPMPLSTGFGSIDRNIGDVKNQGVEFQLNYMPFNTNDFRWSISLNGTHYKNRITNLPQDEINSGYFKWREGESRYNFWGVEYAGVNPENGHDQYWMNVYETIDGKDVVKGREKTEDYNTVSSSDRHKKYLGDAIPNIFGGLTNNFYYKGIDLSFMIYYSIGGKLYDGDYAQMMAYRTGYSLHPDMLEGWSETNTDASLPRITNYEGSYQGSYTSKFLYDNTFFRLRNLTLGYTLPKSLLSRFDVNSLRLFVQGDNIFTVGSAQKRGTDPEQSISGTTNNRFPTTKSISFGIQLNL
jgi:TonB-linked SusC/RagA family outer membrane protein